MQVLYVPSRDQVRTASARFDQHMEPLLRSLERAGSAGHPVAQSRICQDYLQVCRWPFRRLEYSFALEMAGQPPAGAGRALDAGSGVTPFGHALAALGWEVTACDFDRQLMADLAASDVTALFGHAVTYEWQDLTALSYPDESFDLITCVSVIEHIGAPHDKTAFAELLRVLKPGGQLLFTVDFEPPFRGGAHEPRRIARRLVELLRRGDVAGLVASVRKKLSAHRQVSAGEAAHARAPNQGFQMGHLVDDILPSLNPGLAAVEIPFARPLDAVYAEDARAFWDLVPGLFQLQGRRLVLPAAGRYVKPS